MKRLLLAVAVALVIASSAEARYASVTVVNRTSRHGLLWRLAHRSTPAARVTTTTTTTTVTRVQAPPVITKVTLVPVAPMPIVGKK